MDAYSVKHDYVICFTLRIMGILRFVRTSRTSAELLGTYEDVFSATYLAQRCTSPSAPVFAAVIVVRFSLIFCVAYILNRCFASHRLFLVYFSRHR
uniref:Uncharacterized protein n=1 Tax=Parascaris univalens TaxID=6257 RepID=A0A915AC67_PARUN